MTKAAFDKIASALKEAMQSHLNARPISLSANTSRKRKAGRETFTA